MDNFERLEIVDILSMDEYIPAEKIAEKTSVGAKTLRKRLKELNDELEKHGASIEMKHGQGYRLQVRDSEEYFKWKKNLMKMKENTPVTQRERIRYILLLLLNSTTYIKREMIGEFLYVSEKSVSQLLKHVEYILGEYNLTLEKKAKYGIRVTGLEFLKRQCIINHCLMQRSDWKNLDQQVSMGILDLGKLLSEIVIKEKLSFTELALKDLIDYVYITEHRIRHGFYIEKNIEKESTGGNTEIAGRILRHLKERGVEVSLSEPEVTYMALYLEGYRIQRVDYVNASNVVIDEKIDKITDEILESIYQIYRVDLRGDLNLHMSLNKHIMSMDIRLMYNIVLKNPLLQEVKDKYFYSYLLATQSSVVLKSHYKKEISEDEIGYLAMIFEIGRMKTEDEQKKNDILLVCATGKITARFLLMNLQKKFSGSINRIELRSLYELEHCDLSKFDYIFTTVPIDKKVDAPIISIHDFGTASELEKIRRIIESSCVKKFFKEELFFINVPGETMEEAIVNICQLMNEVYPLPEDFCESVLYRESMGSTDFGNLVAIPHPNERKLKDNVVCTAILEHTVMWNKNPVQLVILSALNNSEDKEIQNFFEMVAKLIQRKDLITKIIQNKSYETLCSILECI